jgi:hypothetical protein
LFEFYCFLLILFVWYFLTLQGNWRTQFLDCCGAKGKFLCSLFFPPFVFAVNVANVYRTPEDRKADLCGALDHTRKLAFCLAYTMAPCISGPYMRYVSIFSFDPLVCFLLPGTLSARSTRSRAPS